MAADGNGEATSSDAPVLSEVDLLRQEIQQMRDQQTQLVNALGQRVIKSLYALRRTFFRPSSRTSAGTL